MAPAPVSKAWFSLLHRKGIPESSAPRPKGFPIPLRTRRITSMRSKGRTIILTGDAAGQVKSTTGGGIVFGGNCAAIAGAHADDPASYEMAWRTRFLPDLAMHAFMHDFMRTRTDSQLSDLGRRIKKSKMDVYLSRHGNMDRPIRMIDLRAASHLLANIGGFLYAGQD